VQLFEYPYLVGSLVLLTISTTGLICCPRQRKTILLSGLLSIPGSLTTFLFVPEYWDPVRLFDAVLGIEDILFSFSTGMIAWTISSVFIRESLVPTAGRRMILRYAKVLGMGMVFIALMQLTTIVVMSQALIGIVCISAWLSWNRFRLLPAALKTGAAFALFYTGFLSFTLSKFPGLFSQWTHANLYGIVIIGIPIEEILWSFIFGTCWIMTMGYLLDLNPASVSIERCSIVTGCGTTCCIGNSGQLRDVRQIDSNNC
jgi:hypothetical protein